MTAKFIVNCSHCGVAIRVRGEHSGKLAKCPACKESFIVALAPTAESGPTILKTAVKIPETAMETLAISASDQPSAPHDSKAPETQSPSAGSGSTSQQLKSPKTIVAEPSIGSEREVVSALMPVSAWKFAAE